MIFSALNLVKRRTSDVDISTFNQFFLIAIEEGKNQRPNVRTIHVRIRHDHHTVITEIFNIEILSFNPQAKGRNQRLDLSVFINLGIVGFLDVENFSAQRKNRLKTTIASLFGGASSGISLHNVNLRF